VLNTLAFLIVDHVDRLLLDFTGVRLRWHVPDCVVGLQLLDAVLAAVQVGLVGVADRLDEFAEPEVEDTAFRAGFAPVLAQLVRRAAC
jgi:hypothetical protein